MSILCSVITPLLTNDHKLNIVKQSNVAKIPGVSGVLFFIYLYYVFH